MTIKNLLKNYILHMYINLYNFYENHYDTKLISVNIFKKWKDMDIIPFNKVPYMFYYLFLRLFKIKHTFYQNNLINYNNFNNNNYHIKPPVLNIDINGVCYKDRFNNYNLNIPISYLIHREKLNNFDVKLKIIDKGLIKIKYINLINYYDYYIYDIFKE
jgi:hypothetical protein